MTGKTVITALLLVYVAGTAAYWIADEIRIPARAAE